MKEYPEIWTRAKRDLIIREKSGCVDNFLLEHSLRVATLSQYIAQLPDIVLRKYDEKALVVAGLYHDSGWVVQCREGTIPRAEILSHPTTDVQRELGAVYLEECQKGNLAEDTLDTAMYCIRLLNSREQDLVEAQILSEAVNLNEIGLLSFWNTVRRHGAIGKGVQSAIETWSRQQEYRFWEARISDAFRFEPVRQLALERLRQFGSFMDELQRQHKGMDLLEITGHQPSQSFLPTS